MQETFSTGMGGIVPDPPFANKATPRLPGDVDNNIQGDVTILLYLMETSGLTHGRPGFYAGADFTSDGIVDVVDLLTLVEVFGTD
jgi:hypothetical protein